MKRSKWGAERDEHTGRRESDGRGEKGHIRDETRTCIPPVRSQNAPPLSHTETRTGEISLSSLFIRGCYAKRQQSGKQAGTKSEQTVTTGKHTIPSFSHYLPTVHVACEIWCARRKGVRPPFGEQSIESRVAHSRRLNFTPDSNVRAQQH
ncbi:hypothetical protein TcCL_Unassigned03545 [Trypanosoma cruzi]|nr:hypothetical protein TcCL_Unassigned03545 [Trypanosoma cruzi]